MPHYSHELAAVRTSTSGHALPAAPAQELLERRSEFGRRPSDEGLALASDLHSGASNTLGGNCMDELLSAFVHVYPHVLIRLRVANTRCDPPPRGNARPQPRHR